MIQEEQIEILRSTKKMIWGIFGAMIFTGLGMFLMVIPIFQVPINFAETVFVTYGFIIGLLCVLFFGIGAAILFWNLFDNKPLLTINRQGIIDNKSTMLVPWSDIERIDVVKLHRNKFLAIIVKKPQDYIDRATNPFQRKMAEMSFKISGSPINFSTHIFQIKHDDLLKLLTEKLDEYKML